MPVATSADSRPHSTTTPLYTNDPRTTNGANAFLNVEGHVFSQRVPNPAYTGPETPGVKPRLGSGSTLPYYHVPGAEAHLYYVPASDVVSSVQTRLSDASAAAGLAPPSHAVVYSTLEGTPLSSFAQASFSSAHGGSLCFRGAVNGRTLSATNTPSPVSVFFVLPAVVGHDSSAALGSEGSASVSSTGPGSAASPFVRLANTSSLSQGASAPSDAPSGSRYGRGSVARAVSQPFTGSGSRARHDVTRVGVRYDGETALAGLCWSQGAGAAPAAPFTAGVSAGEEGSTNSAAPVPACNALGRLIRSALDEGSLPGVLSDSVVESWAGYRGPRFSTVVHGGIAAPTGETDLNISTVYEAGPLLGVQQPGAPGSSGHPAGGSGVVGQGGGRSFQLGYEWRHWGAEHVFSFLHRLIMRRKVVNPMERGNVVGIHNYVDVGLQIAFDGAKDLSAGSINGGGGGSGSHDVTQSSPRTPRAGGLAGGAASDAASHLSAMSLVTAWQLNSNTLLKARVRDSDAAVVLGLKNWSVPSSTLALSGKYTFASNKVELGLRLEMENFGRVLHHRLGAEEIARVESKFVPSREYERAEQARSQQLRI
jgi:hypothetical protein